MYFALILILLIGISSMAWGFYDGGYLNFAFAILGVGMLWGLSIWRRWNWFSGLGLIAFTLAAAAGLWLNLLFVWMLVGGVCGLLVYDLSAFVNRIRYSVPGKDTKRLERTHLIRLGWLVVLIVIFSSVAMFWQSAFSFEGAIFLGLTGVWGVSILVRWMIRN